MYDYVEKMCLDGNENEIKNCILNHKVRIDDNLLEIITCLNNFQLFKFALDNGATPNENILTYCTHKGHIEHVKYMIEKVEK